MSILSAINCPQDVKGLNDNELVELSKEIREFIIDSVSKTGGHLASNLGIVEVTLALHRVFDSPSDKIIWDVGHQSYVHKIITGRKNEFNNLRKFGGISGFPKTSESEHDIFNSGHSSTSISAALGFAKARDIKGEKNKVIAVIGDGALSGGMAFEALNDAGQSKSNLIVVLNDNEMSIAQNVGGLSKYLSTIRTQPFYSSMSKNIDNMLHMIPAIGDSVAKTLEKAKGSIKHFIIPGQIFENLGFTYLGPVDGHNITDLTKFLSMSKELDGPILIHVLTKKGKGYKIAEDKPSKFHGISSFNINTGEVNKVSKKSFSDSFGDSICNLAKDNQKIVAITAAMPEGTGLLSFSEKFPNRFFDVGIAEQHAVTFAGGLAKEGIKPIVAVYSTFLQRAYDQILHDIALQKLPVVFAIDRAGIVGNDGETHHGVFDISYLSHIPNMIIMAPRNYYDQKEMLKFSINFDKGPIAIRYPRGCEEDLGIENTTLEFGKSETMLEGDDIIIIGVGNMANIAFKVANRLRNDGLSAGAVNARFIKPIDHELIMDCINNEKKIIVIEDNVIHGGYGSLILEFLNSQQVSTSDVKIFGYDDQFVTHGNSEDLYRIYGMDQESIYNEIYKTISISVRGR